MVQYVERCLLNLQQPNDVDYWSRRILFKHNMEPATFDDADDYDDDRKMDFYFLACWSCMQLSEI